MQLFVQITVALLWIVPSIVVYGVLLGWLHYEEWERRERLRDMDLEEYLKVPLETRKNRGVALAVALFGPIALLPVLIMTGFAAYGMKFW